MREPIEHVKKCMINYRVLSDQSYCTLESLIEEMCSIPFLRGVRFYVTQFLIENGSGN